MWALRQVSFDLRQGDALGIIGANGAGKSTLLKILSRVTEPTEGRARVAGRLGALLEVGAGFHPELTGRENIYLNGAIIGMSRADINQRFDDIVEFSGLVQFLDTPVKYYSSGMYMRLAFAVSAHLEPDILVVDEVLAVGDVEFQKKCLGKMSEVIGQGRTLIFVSHDPLAVQRLCSRAILLNRGKVVCDGRPREVLQTYESTFESARESEDLSEAPGRLAGMLPVLRRLKLRDGHGNPTTSIGCGDPLIVELDYAHQEELPSPHFGLMVETIHGTPLSHLASDIIVSHLPDCAPPQGTAICRIDSVPLMPGQYRLTLGCRTGIKQLDLVHGAATFEVVSANFYGTGRLPDAGDGFALMRAAWRLADTDKDNGPNARQAD